MNTPSSARVRFWMVFPFALMGCMVLGLVLMAVVAADDPGFSLERDYYQKAVHWDVHRAQLQANETLGWRLRSEIEPQARGSGIRLRASDRQGKPLSGASVEVEAFAVARGNATVVQRLPEMAPGTYYGEVPLRRIGLWELRFTVRRGDRVFTQVERLERVAEGKL